MKQRLKVGYYKLSRVSRKIRGKQLINRYGIKEKTDFNIIILTIECCRNDYLRNDDNALVSTLPMNKAAYFVNCYSSSSWTMPSISSIMTALYPSQHLARFLEESRNFDEKKVADLIKYSIRDDVLSISEILENSQGYLTYLDSGGLLLAEIPIRGRYGLVKANYPTDFSIQVDSLIRLLDNNKYRTFAHIHIINSHQPLMLPEKWLVQINEIDYSDEVRNWNYRDGKDLNSKEFISYKAKKVSLYKLVLRYIFAKIARLYDLLNQAGLADNTIIIITADHGEEFWDHVELEKRYFYDPRGFYGVGHGHNMFNEITRVPLILFGPGIRPGVYTHPVSHVDIVPTILDLLGLEYDDLMFEGVNLFQKDEERVIIVEDIAYGYDKLAIIQGDVKYLIAPWDKVFWKFNLSKDPHENSPETLEVDEIKEMCTLIKFKSKISPILDKNTALGSLFKRYFVR